MALTPKQALFVQEYIVSKNATQAALKAGYSANTAHKIGSENLHKGEVRDAIDKGLAAQLDAINTKNNEQIVTKQEWLEELKLLAFADMDDFAEVIEKEVLSIDDDGRETGYTRIAVEPVLTRKRKKLLGRVIKKLTETKNGISLELHSKQAALDTLGKHFGWIKDKVEHSGPDDGPLVVITLPSNGREVKDQK